MDFWLGAVVRRRFAAGWFLGTVVDVSTDEGKTYYKVDYEDFDQDELDAGELWDAVIYHPKLDADHYHYKQLPQTKDIVLFTSGQGARLGEVTAIDPADRRPITIALLKPDSKAASLVTARYARGLEDGQDISMQLLPLQIRTSSLKLREDGHLTADSQRTLSQILKPTKKSAGRKRKKRMPSSLGSKTVKGRRKPTSKTRTKSRKTPESNRTLSKYYLRKR